ncbi:hypothetical protein Vafri_14 [Volvox africanus]|nr:hypothetical protein Vafri_14 [Volvox africanus]
MLVCFDHQIQTPSVGQSNPLFSSSSASGSSDEEGSPAIHPGPIEFPRNLLDHYYIHDPSGEADAAGTTVALPITGTQRVSIAILPSHGSLGIRTSNRKPSSTITDLGISSPMGSVSQLQRHRQFGPLPSSPDSISTVSSRRSSRAPPPPGYNSHSCVQLGCERHSSGGSLTSVTPPAGFRSTNTFCRSDAATYYPDLISPTASTASVPHSKYFRQSQPRYNPFLGPDFGAAATVSGNWRSAAARSNPDASWRYYAADPMTENQGGVYDAATVSELRRRRARQVLSQQLVAADKVSCGADDPIGPGVAAVGKIPLPPMPAPWRQQVQLWEKQERLQQQEQGTDGPHDPPDGLMERGKTPPPPIPLSKEHQQQIIQQKVTRRRTPAPWVAEHPQLHESTSQRQNFENRLSQKESLTGVGNLARVRSPAAATAGKARTMALNEEGADRQKRELQLTEPGPLLGGPVNNLMTNSQSSKLHSDNAPEAGGASDLLDNVTLLPADPITAVDADQNQDEDDVRGVPGTVTPPGRSHRPLVLRGSARSSSSGAPSPTLAKTSTSTSTGPEFDSATTPPDRSSLPGVNLEPQGDGDGRNNGVSDDTSNPNPNPNPIVRSTAEAKSGEPSRSVLVLPELSALSPSLPSGSTYRGVGTRGGECDLRATAMLEAQLQFFPLKFVLAEVKPQTATGRSDVCWEAPAPVTVRVTVPMQSTAVAADTNTSGQECKAAGAAAAAVMSVKALGEAEEATDRGDNGETMERHDSPGRRQVASDAAESREKPQQQYALHFKPECIAKDNAATENGAQVEVSALPTLPTAPAAAAAAQHVERPERMPVMAPQRTTKPSGVAVFNAAVSQDSDIITQKGATHYGTSGIGERKDSAQEIFSEAAKKKRAAKPKKVRKGPRDAHDAGGREFMMPMASPKGSEVTTDAVSIGMAMAPTVGSHPSPSRPRSYASSSSTLKVAGPADPDAARGETNPTRAKATTSGTTSKDVSQTRTNQECSVEGDSQTSWQSRKINGSRPRGSPEQHNKAAINEKAKARASSKAVGGSTVQSTTGMTAAAATAAAAAAAAATAAIPVGHLQRGRSWGQVWSFLFRYQEDILDDDGSSQDGEEDETGQQGGWRTFTVGLLLSAALVCGSAHFLSRLSEAQQQLQEVHQQQHAILPQEQGLRTMLQSGAALPVSDPRTSDAMMENSSNLKINSMPQPSPSPSRFACGSTDGEIASGFDEIDSSSAPAGERGAASDDTAATGAEDGAGLEGIVARDESREKGAEQQSLMAPTSMSPSEAIASHPQYRGSDLPAWLGKDPQAITAELEELLTEDVRPLEPEEDAMPLGPEASARQSNTVAVLEGRQVESSETSEEALHQGEPVQAPTAVAESPAVAQVSADESKGDAGDHQGKDGAKAGVITSKEVVASDALATVVDHGGKSFSVSTHPLCVGLSISAVVVVMTSALLWAAGRHCIIRPSTTNWNSLWRMGSIASAWKSGNPAGRANRNGAIGQVQGLPGGDDSGHVGGHQEEQQQRQQPPPHQQQKQKQKQMQQKQQKQQKQQQQQQQQKQQEKQQKQQQQRQQQQDHRRNPTAQRHFLWDIAPNAALLNCFFLRSNRLVPRGGPTSQDGAGGAGAIPGASDGWAGGVGGSGRSGLSVGYHWLRNRTIVCFNKPEMSPEARRLMPDVQN